MYQARLAANPLIQIAIGDWLASHTSSGERSHQNIEDMRI
jgi:hypothetical protein